MPLLGLFKGLIFSVNPHGKKNNSPGFPRNIYLHCLASVSRYFAPVVSTDVFWLSGSFSLLWFQMEAFDCHFGFPPSPHRKSRLRPQVMCIAEPEGFVRRLPQFRRHERTAATASGTQSRKEFIS